MKARANIAGWMFLSITIIMSLLLVSPIYAQQKAKILKVGYIGPLSGPVAKAGIDNKRSVELAADKINAAGGVKINGVAYKVKVIGYDDKSDAHAGIVAFDKLLKQNVKFIFGPFATESSLVVVPLAEAHKIIIFPGGWGESVIGPSFTYAFRPDHTTLEANDVLIDYIIKTHPDAKTMVLVAPDHVGGVTGQHYMEEYAAQHGIRVVLKEFFEPCTKEKGCLSDHDTYINKEIKHHVDKILEVEADIVDLGSTMGDLEGLFIHALHEAGYKGITVSNFCSHDHILGITGPKALEGAYSTAAMDYYDEKAPTLLKELRHAYHKKYGQKSLFTYPAEYNYDAALMLFKAIEACNSLDTKCVRDALLKVDHTLVSGVKAKWGGEKTYGINRQLLRPVPISRWENGKLKFVSYEVPAIE